MLTRQQIVDEARTWIGTPWRHQAMTKGVGADCLGFLAGLAYDLGYCDARTHVREPEQRAYGREADPALLYAACEQYLDRVPLQEARLADIIQMRPANGVYAQHFALVSRVDAYDKPTHIVHCYALRPRGVIEHGINDEWRGRFRRAYAWRGVA
jgi:NlpC/P60 family putative phage cell wall peptidase